MKVICPVCEKVVGAYIPKGGDGSAYRPRRHGDCDGRFDLVEELYEERLLTKDAADFRRARGVIPWEPGDELPEDAIRRLRGG